MAEINETFVREIPSEDDRAAWASDGRLLKALELYRRHCKGVDFDAVIERVMNEHEPVPALV